MLINFDGGYANMDDVKPEYEDDAIMEGGGSPIADPFSAQGQFMEQYQLFLAAQPTSVSPWPASYDVNQRFGFTPPSDYLGDADLGL